MSAKSKPDQMASLKERLRNAKNLSRYAGDARDWNLCDSTDKEIEELEAEIANFDQCPHCGAYYPKGKPSPCDWKPISNG